MVGQADQLLRFAARLHDITLDMPKSRIADRLTKLADEMELAGRARQKEETQQLRRLLRNKHVGA